jgi:hypothetical protein
MKRQVPKEDESLSASLERSILTFGHCRRCISSALNNRGVKLKVNI